MIRRLALTTILITLVASSTALAAPPGACLAHPQRGSVRKLEDYLNQHFQQHPVVYKGRKIAVQILSCRWYGRDRNSKGPGWRQLRCMAGTDVGLTYAVTVSFGFQPRCSPVVTWHLE